MEMWNLMDDVKKMFGLGLHHKSVYQLEEGICFVHMLGNVCDIDEFVTEKGLSLETLTLKTKAGR